VHVMASTDPLMGASGYPLLFQTGETANGRDPLIDRQHPHDLVMEAAATYSLNLRPHTSLFVYAGLLVSRRWGRVRSCTGSRGWMSRKHRCRITGSIRRTSAL